MWQHGLNNGLPRIETLDELVDGSKRFVKNVKLKAILGEMLYTSEIKDLGTIKGIEKIEAVLELLAQLKDKLKLDWECPS